VLLREDPDTPEALRTRCAGLAERVATGLVCERIGLQPVGRQMLAAADAVALG